MVIAGSSAFEFHGRHGFTCASPTSAEMYRLQMPKVHARYLTTRRGVFDKHLGVQRRNAALLSTFLLTTASWQPSGGFRVGIACSNVCLFCKSFGRMDLPTDFSNTCDVVAHGIRLQHMARESDINIPSDIAFASLPLTSGVAQRPSRT
jgi:hypothetical protein